MFQEGIRQLGDPVLREKSKPVEAVTGEIKNLIDTMVRAMDKAQGVGLAASQIGVAKRIFIYRYEERLHVIINPEIIESEGEVIADEGCLSIVGIEIPVARAEKVKVKAKGQDDNEILFEAEGLHARIIQHETDHLDGILVIDRVSGQVKQEAMKKYEEFKKREY